VPDETPPIAADPPRPFAELSGSGVLWAINRALLHYRGYALAIHRDADGNATGWSLQGDGSEPWFYESSADEDRHFADFEATLREQTEREDAR
jgi:hypothetical protein